MMNEQLNKLAQESGIADVTFCFAHGSVHSPAEQNQIIAKFAESIVDQTIDLLQQEWYELNTARDVDDDQVRYHKGKMMQTLLLQSKIKEHWGIKIK